MAFNYVIKHADLTQKSGTVIVMAAFTAHFLKEISRTQVAKRLMPEDKKRFATLEKNDFLVPLGKVFVEKGIVKIRHKGFIA